MEGSNEIELQEVLLDGGIEHTHFFNGRLLTAESLQNEQGAQAQRDALLGQAIGPGVIQGLEVSPRGGADPQKSRLTVQAGSAINDLGQLLALNQAVDLRLTNTLETTTDEQCDFSPCTDTINTLSYTGEGLYLLVVRPGEGYKGSAPTIGLNAGQSSGCGQDRRVSGVSFDALPLKEGVSIPTTLNPEHACFDQHYRSVAADRCLTPVSSAAEGSLAWFTDPDLTRQDGTRSLFALGDADVPLALLYWGGKGIEYVDMWSGRRPCVPGSALGEWPLNDQGRDVANAKARLFQFQAQIAGMTQGSITSGCLPKVPAAGFLPNLDVAKKLFEQQQTKKADCVDPSRLRGWLAQSWMRDPIALSVTDKRVVMLIDFDDYTFYMRCDADCCAQFDEPVAVKEPVAVVAEPAGLYEEEGDVAPPIIGEVDMVVTINTNDPESVDLDDLDVSLTTAAGATLTSEERVSDSSLPGKVVVSFSYMGLAAGTYSGSASYNGGSPATGTATGTATVVGESPEFLNLGLNVNFKQEQAPSADQTVVPVQQKASANVLVTVKDEQGQAGDAAKLVAFLMNEKVREKGGDETITASHRKSKGAGVMLFSFEKLIAGEYWVAASYNGGVPVSKIMSVPGEAQLELVISSGKTQEIKPNKEEEIKVKEEPKVEVPEKILERWEGGWVTNREVDVDIYVPTWLLKPYPEPRPWADFDPLHDPVPEAVYQNTDAPDLLQQFEKVGAEAIHLYVDKAHDPQRVSKDPASYLVLGESGSAVPVVLVAKDTDPKVRGKASEYVDQIREDVVLVDAESLYLEGLIAGAWTGLVEELSGLTGAKSAELIHAAQSSLAANEAEVQVQVKEEAGASSTVNTTAYEVPEKLAEVGVKTVEEVANMNGHRLAQVTGTTVTQAEAEISKAREKVGADKWALEQAAVALNQQEIKALSELGVKTQYELYAAAGQDRAKLEQVIGTDKVQAVEMATEALQEKGNIEMYKAF